MLSKIKEFVKSYKKLPQPHPTTLQRIVKNYKSDIIINIILIIIVILISLLSFGAGFLVAKYQQKQPLEFEDIYNEESSSSYSFIS